MATNREAFERFWLDGNEEASLFTKEAELAWTVWQAACITTHQNIEAAVEKELSADYPAKSQYLPIEYAPKDGTVILILISGSDIPNPYRWIHGNWRSAWDGSIISKYDTARYWMPIPNDPDAQPPNSRD